jgi:signal transduction histidine kinase
MTHEVQRVSGEFAGGDNEPPSGLIETVGLVLLRPRRHRNRAVQDFEIVSISGYCGQLLARTPDRVIGMGLCELLPELRKTGCFKRLVGVLGNGQSFEDVFANDSPQLTVRRIRFEALGHGDAVVLMARDAEQEKAVWSRLAQAERMNAVGRLTLGVAHDFNNMLSVITASCALARGSLPAGAQQADNIDQALSAAQRAIRLSQRLLAFSRQPNVEPLPTDVSAVVHDTAQFIELLVGSRVRLSVHTESGARALLDPVQLEQLIINLVVNARDAMPEGGVLRIDSAVVRGSQAGRADPPAGDYVRLRVSDTGIGMPAEVRSRIFEPFFTTKPEHQGTGLGLALVSDFVRQSHGHIAVDSQPGQGTTFTVFWPCIREHRACQRSVTTNIGKNMLCGS